MIFIIDNNITWLYISVNDSRLTSMRILKTFKNLLKNLECLFFRDGACFSSYQFIKRYSIHIFHNNVKPIFIFMKIQNAYNIRMIQTG